jgi:hypothetical protein
MRRAALALLAFAALLAAVIPALACSCARNPTAAGILASADAVFTAIVVHSEPAGKNISITTFRIVEAFKGPAAGSTVEVRHRSGPSASCGVKFAVGRSYTLAAHRVGARLATTLCSTWMFLPQVGLSQGLIKDMRELRGPPRP